MSSLYEIAAKYRADLAALADLELDNQTVADTLDGMQGDLQDKLRAVIAYSLDLDVLATGTEEAAKRMADLAKARRARVQELRDYALTTMQGCGIGEIATDEWGAKLGPAKLSSSSIPVFFALDASGKPTGRKIDGGAWDENVPANMAPKLGAFFGAP